jgi:hypothetical protein
MQVKIDEKLVKDHLRGVGATEVSVNPPRLYPKVAVEGSRERETPIPLEFLLIWGHLDKRRNLC